MFLVEAIADTFVIFLELTILVIFLRLSLKGETGNRGIGESGKRGNGETGNRGNGETGNRGNGESGKRGIGETGNRRIRETGMLCGSQSENSQF